jgi:heat shock protein HslJ/uncharacterized membrane protein
MKKSIQNYSLLIRIITLLILTLGKWLPVFADNLKIQPFEPIRSQYEKYFAYLGGSEINYKILLLDSQRDPISSKLDLHYLLTRNSESNQIMLTNETLIFTQKKWDLGIDFYAIGNEPSWDLDIDFDMGMRFKSLTEFSEMNTPPAREDKAQDADVTRYFAQSDEGTLIATVSRRMCSDTMSDEQFPYKVIIDIKRIADDDYTIFNGCGRYVMDTRINDIWVLTHFRGRALHADDFDKGLPILEFHLRDKKVVGSTGCNRINGRFEARGDELTIRNLASTKMACTNMTLEQELLTVITGKTLWYSIIDGRLILTDKAGNLMEMKKID